MDEWSVKRDRELQRQKGADVDSNDILKAMSRAGLKHVQHGNKPKLEDMTNEQRLKLQLSEAAAKHRLGNVKPDDPDLLTSLLRWYIADVEQRRRIWKEFFAQWSIDELKLLKRHLLDEEHITSSPSPSPPSSLPSPSPSLPSVIETPENNPSATTPSSTLPTVSPTSSATREPELSTKTATPSSTPSTPPSSTPPSALPTASTVEVQPAPSSAASTPPVSSPSALSTPTPSVPREEPPSLPSTPSTSSSVASTPSQPTPSVPPAPSTAPTTTAQTSTPSPSPSSSPSSAVSLTEDPTHPFNANRLAWLNLLKSNHYAIDLLEKAIDEKSNPAAPTKESKWFLLMRELEHQLNKHPT